MKLSGAMVEENTHLEADHHEEAIATAVERHINGQLERTGDAISRNTRITIGAAATVLVTVLSLAAGMAWKAGQWKASVEASVAANEKIHTRNAAAVQGLAGSVSELALSLTSHAAGPPHLSASRDIERNRVKVEEMEKRLRAVEIK